MSEEQHTIDEENKLPHKPMCLNRHVSVPAGEGKGNTCSHRWQAYLKMQDDAGLYNWPKYKSLSERRSRIPTLCQWGPNTVTQPSKATWDVGFGSNFQDVCYKPYWHEAHHVVPNSTLRNAIVDFAKSVQEGSKLIVTLRRGLLTEQYNLNAKNNMIMLPMDKVVADALGLPRHRKRPTDFNHSVYSEHVALQLEKLFSQLQQELLDHKKPKYSNLKKRIEDLSEQLYTLILQTSGPSLDDMEEYIL